MQKWMLNVFVVVLSASALAQGHAVAQNPPITLDQCAARSRSVIDQGEMMLGETIEPLIQIHSQIPTACSPQSTNVACAEVNTRLGLAQAAVDASRGLIDLGALLLTSCPQLVDFEEKQAKICAADLALYQAEEKIADSAALVAASNILNPAAMAEAIKNGQAAKRSMSELRANMAAIPCPNMP